MRPIPMTNGNPHRMNVLSRYETRILGAFAKTLLPATDLLSETPDDIGLAGRIDAHLGYISKNLRLDFRAILWIFEFGGLFFGLRPFSFLNESQKGRYLEKWRRSSFYPARLLYKYVESLCYLNYYSHPAITRKIGFEPPPVRPRARRLEIPEIPDRDLCLGADVCIIGAGAGGAVVAKELAERGRSVCLLEEGGYFDVQEFGKEPVEVVRKVYHNAGLQMTLGFPCILLPTGKAVGGTTLINSGTCFRLPEEVIGRWQREFGLAEITSEALDPYFDRVEKRLHVTTVSDEILGKNANIFKRGLERMGLQGAPLRRNADDCQGSGMCCFGCPTEAKQSVQLSYIPDALKYGARLLTKCRVETIIPRQSHGGEVIALRGDRVVRIDAKVVVIAAGALNTPYLLRKNHIALHNPHIGRHLSIHPCVRVSALFDEEVRGWEGVPQGYYYDGLAKEGIMLEGIFTPPSFGSVSLGLGPRDGKEVMERYKQMASFGILMTDEGRGWIRWLPNGDPIIHYSLRRHEIDRYIKAVRLVSEVFLAAGAKRVFTSVRSLPEVTPESGLRPFGERKFKRSDFLLSAFHPLGTCRMGVDPSRSVVNSFGEMHDVKNLFIADGSIFPTPLKVNPQETIMAFATRTAEFIDAKSL